MTDGWVRAASADLGQHFRVRPQSSAVRQSLRANKRKRQKMQQEQQAQQAESEQPVIEEEALVGTRVCVWWGGDGRWYSGVIDALRPRRGTIWHRVSYDDGDVKWHALSEGNGETWRLEPAHA